MCSPDSVMPSSYLAPFSRAGLARAFVATGLLLLVACGQAPQPYDVAINHGRVIDPASRLDAVRSVGIRSGKIAAISETPLEAENVVDARGLVVSPRYQDKMRRPHFLGAGLFVCKPYFSGASRWLNQLLVTASRNAVLAPNRISPPMA